MIANAISGSTIDEHSVAYVGLKSQISDSSDLTTHSAIIAQSATVRYCMTSSFFWQ